MTSGDAPASGPWGNAPVPGGVKTFECPSCGGTVGIRATGITITAVCQHCGSIIDVANDNLKIIQEAAVKVRKTTIPLGARGTLGVEWEMIGYCERSDDTETYFWSEYLLFNPYQGFRYLVEADGHWNFVKMLRHSFEGGGTPDALHYDGLDYRVFTRGKAKVQYVMGEFYWRVKLGDMADVADYVAPPYMLSMEKSDQDIMWSQAVYVDSDEIRDAFGIKGNMPFQRGVAPNQPSPVAEQWKGIKLAALIFFIVLCVLQVGAIKRASNQIIYQRTVEATPNYRGHLILSDPLVIPGDKGNLEVHVYSPVNNDWLELDISLVDDATGASEDIIEPVEYYYGHDSDGNWTEGSHVNYSVLSAVRGGNYHLQVEPDAGAFKRNQPVTFTLTVMRDVPVWANFFAVLLLVMAYPIYLANKQWRFEVARWSNSDYAPARFRPSSG